MGIGLVKTADAAARVPTRADEKTLYIDLDGVLKVMGSDGIPLPAIGGNVVSLAASGSDPAAQADVIKIYCKLVEGTATLFLRDDLGNVVQVGSGSVAAPTFRWKGGTPGNPYIDGDSVVAAFGDIIMYSINADEEFAVTLPLITTESAGRTIGLRNLINIKDEAVGVADVTPNAADTIEFFATGEPVDTQGYTHLVFESDGVGRWNVISATSGTEVLAEIP